MFLYALRNYHLRHKRLAGSHGAVQYVPPVFGFFVSYFLLFGKFYHFAALFSASTNCDNWSLPVLFSTKSRCPKYCLPKKIAIAAFVFANANWQRLRLCLPFADSFLYITSKLVLYVAFSHRSNVLCDTRRQFAISSFVHCISHISSNNCWSICFFGLPAGIYISFCIKKGKYLCTHLVACCCY